MFKRTLDLGLTSKEKRKWPCIQFYNRRCTNCDYPEGGKLSKCMKKRKFISLLLIYDLQLNILSVFSEYYCLTLGQSAHLSAWCPPQSTFSPLILGTQFEFFQAQSPLHWYLNQKIRCAIIWVRWFCIAMSQQNHAKNCGCCPVSVTVSHFNQWPDLSFSICQKLSTALQIHTITTIAIFASDSGSCQCLF